MSEPAPRTEIGAPGAPRRPPATLNLLIRSEDGESFETREISSPGA